MKRLVAMAVLVVFAAGAAAFRLADGKPDPHVQAVADGCQRDTPKLYTGYAPNWVYVNDGTVPASSPSPGPRWVAGVVKGASGLLASRVASSDDPITHRSYDANIDVTVDPQYDYLTGVSRDGTSEQGTLHLERESGSYPFWTWPQPGDRIQALGSWVWDCDHYQGRGEKTELHPYRATWVVRHPGRVSPSSSRGEAEGDLYVSNDATPAGLEAQCAHETKGSGDFKTCTHQTSELLGVDGAYRFTLCAPRPAPRGAHLLRRVVDRGSVSAPPVTVSPSSPGCVQVSFTIAGSTTHRLVVAKQVFLGWSKPPRFERLRLHFDSLLVRRAMDPSCPTDRPSCPSAAESTLLGQIATPPGEWQLTWSVDGIWGRWPGTLAARDGSTFPGRQSVDFSLQPRQPWTLVVLARECDFGAVPAWDGPGHALAPCPVSNEVGNSEGDDYPGAIAVTHRGAALGRHVVDASTAGSTCPPVNVHGCYRLTYTVRRLR